MINKILEFTGKIFLSVVFIFGSIATVVGVIALGLYVLNGLVK